MRKGTLEKIIARGPTNAPLHIMVSFFAKYYGSFYTVRVRKWFSLGHLKSILLTAHVLGKAGLALQRTCNRDLKARVRKLTGLEAVAAD